MSYEGLLAIHKPPHFTSHDVVAKLRRILGMKRIGHTGTLDPLVTGVLPICLGRATRIAEYIQDLPKQYEAELTLGISTDTEDSSGVIIDKIPCELVTVDDHLLTKIFSDFCGEISQVPPMYSAVKINGQKLYHLARAGVDVERHPRIVNIFEIEFLERKMNEEGYPVIRFRVLCSKGTYIRTLCYDIGKAMGYPAVMSNLVRTRSGGFDLSQCLDLDEAQKKHECGHLHDFIVPADKAIEHFPIYTCDESECKQLITGQKLVISEQFAFQTDQPVRGYNLSGEFIGLLTWDAIHKQLIPKKIWLQP
jgi:tRNA pseudouridine55 synthase